MILIALQMLLAVVTICWQSSIRWVVVTTHLPALPPAELDWVGQSSPWQTRLVTSPSDLWFSLTKVSRTVVADASWYHVIISVLGIRRQK
ncbi:uncharacterized protein K444DRAFT_303176 [Hyaloscypha bicolor E]|uniref:Secreted protein n=1 Tax=Hyaloscypha bicolor E TaxID=1095630 RepID=A0A2J6TN51_9HELO|nr:uncharacterized protein K444DRAFT_303176 [Hyaloscypha bicolor E]PMD64440.1 hypothetical protein K444DRAFT_303176 [Hyaloscypha bicolor E]